MQQKVAGLRERLVTALPTEFERAQEQSARRMAEAGDPHDPPQGARQPVPPVSRSILRQLGGARQGLSPTQRSYCPSSIEQLHSAPYRQAEHDRDEQEDHEQDLRHGGCRA